MAMRQTTCFLIGCLFLGAGVTRALKFDDESSMLSREDQHDPLRATCARYEDFVKDTGMELKRLNTDTAWYLEVGGVRLAIDPWLEGDAVTFSPQIMRETFKGPHVSVTWLKNNVDAILVSQAVHDNMHFETLSKLGKPIYAVPEAFDLLKAGRHAGDIKNSLHQIPRAPCGKVLSNMHHPAVSCPHESSPSSGKLAQKLVDSLAQKTLAGSQDALKEEDSETAWEEQTAQEEMEAEIARVKKEPSAEAEGHKDRFGELDEDQEPRPQTVGSNLRKAEIQTHDRVFPSVSYVRVAPSRNAGAIQSTLHALVINAPEDKVLVYAPNGFMASETVMKHRLAIGSHKRVTLVAPSRQLNFNIDPTLKLIPFGMGNNFQGIWKEELAPGLEGLEQHVKELQPDWHFDTHTGVVERSGIMGDTILALNEALGQVCKTTLQARGKKVTIKEAPWAGNLTEDSDHVLNVAQ
jgi:hypothetical protein